MCAPEIHWTYCFVTGELIPGLCLFIYCFLQYTDWNTSLQTNNCKILATSSWYVYCLVILSASTAQYIRTDWLQYYCTDWFRILLYMHTYNGLGVWRAHTFDKARDHNYLSTSIARHCTPTVIPLTLPGGCHLYNIS